MRTIGALLFTLALAACGSSSTNPSDGGNGGAGTGGQSGATGDAGQGSGGAGTGGASGTNGVVSHCDTTNGGTHLCNEYGADYTVDLEASCTVIDGMYAMGGCDHSGSAGGCMRTVAGVGTHTTFFYAPLTADDVMVQCKNDGNATYVSP